MRSRRPRLDAELYVGPNRYFLTFCTAGRNRWFTRQDDVQLVLDQILRSASALDIEVIAYCFMPDHVHLLVEGLSAVADACRFVHQAKQRTGYAFGLKHPGKKLWQPSYYDRILRDEESTLPVIRYILENPVRAQLVDSPAEYLFSGSPRYALEEILEAARWQP